MQCDLSYHCLLSVTLAHTDATDAADKSYVSIRYIRNPRQNFEKKKSKNFDTDETPVPAREEIN